MNLHDLNILEYNKILKSLSLYCKTYIGKDFAMQLNPVSNSEKVQKLLNETLEANSLEHRKGNPPISDIEDISVYLKQLESNISLKPKALLEIGLILKISRELKDYFYKDDNFDLSSFTILSDLFSKLYANIDLEKSIFSIILDENTIADDASAKLKSLRKSRKKLESDVKETLTKILHSSTYSKAIMDPIVTIRNDRYVIPVKEEFRGLIKGFIHDMSSSGSTIFVEPMQVFEINNQIQSIKFEENTEIEHILEELSNKVSSYIDELKNNVYLIGKLDFIFAKSKLANSMEATIPVLNNNKIINLKKARHPLIDKDVVVPIDISIGKDYTSLIITGPNTGGKTVTLKTCGLLVLMASSGLFIPAEEESSIYVFDNVFADIGDEQSIEGSLSTFSSHIGNIINIVSNSTSNSLILIDELGSGTDPIEGAALAISILEHFHKLGAITLTTTHYQEIKNYALTAEGFENASSSFDIENLKPTYQLLIGVPGKSNAFAISKKLGLSEDILVRAKSLLNNDDISYEEVIKNIYDDKIAIEKDKEETRKNLVQAENLRKSLEQEKNMQIQVKNDKQEKAKIETQNILLNAKEEVNSIIKELNDLYNKFKGLENIDIKNLSDSQIADIVKNNFKENALSDANIIRNKLNKSINTLVKANSSEDFKNTSITKDDLKVGMKIKLYNFSEPATITSLSGKKDGFQVVIGNIKTNAKLSDIEEIKSIKVSTVNNFSTKVISNSSLKSKTVNSEINVIGQNVEDACFVIDKFLDDCFIAKISPVRIVHGKGTGKLREGIHTFLTKNSHVKSFRLGTFGEGEMGVTVVELK